MLTKQKTLFVLLAFITLILTQNIAHSQENVISSASLECKAKTRATPIFQLLSPANWLNKLINSDFQFDISNYKIKSTSLTKISSGGESPSELSYSVLNDTHSFNIDANVDCSVCSNGSRLCVTQQQDLIQNILPSFVEYQNPDSSQFKLVCSKDLLHNNLEFSCELSDTEKTSNFENFINLNSLDANRELKFDTLNSQIFYNYLRAQDEDCYIKGLDSICSGFLNTEEEPIQSLFFELGLLPSKDFAIKGQVMFECQEKMINFNKNETSCTLILPAE